MSPERSSRAPVATARTVHPERPFAPGRRLFAHAERLARAGFELPATDLAEINAWLIEKTAITSLFVLGFCYLLSLVGGPQLPLGLITVLCVLTIATGVPFRRWLADGRSLGLLVYAQFLFSILVLTVGFSQIPNLPVLFHLQFLMVVVTSALLSRQCGTIMTVLCIGAHLFLVWLKGPFSVAEVLGPVYFLVVIAHQCFYYGARLVAKTRQADDASTVASALLRVADELSAERTSQALVQRLAMLAKELASGSWAAVALRDPVGAGYSVDALVSRLGLIDDEVLSVGLPASDELDRRIAAAGDGCIVAESAAASLLPSELHQRWRAGSYLASVLRHGGEPLGILFVGFDEPARTRSDVSRHLVVGMARQAVLALENARLLEDLQRASTLKSEFISTISHEFRSPLHAIIGFNDMLRDEEVDDPDAGASRRDILERVRVHAYQLHEMIEATLNVSRMESGRLPVRYATHSVRHLLGEVDAEIPDFRRKPGVALEWRLPDDLPPLETDGSKLKMIVRNLVDNALKFTDEGRVTVTVELEQRPGTVSRLRVAVSDTGIGIPPELRAAVFEMFRQGDGSLTRRHAGVGLGLYIVRRLVEVLRGTIVLESEPGRGSRFEVSLPILLPGTAALGEEAATSARSPRGWTA